MTGARATQHTQISGKGVVQLAMYVGRICAGRLRPVTAGEIQELLCCNRATAYRYLQAYKRVYADHVDAQQSGLLAQGSPAVAALVSSQADSEAELLRAAAARSDEYDGVDPDYPE